MNFSHISIGGGITGIETVINIVENILKKSNKKKIKNKIKIAIIDKNPKNIPGGVGYGMEISKYGYFNNPIRLSPKIFQKWILKDKNKKKIIKYLKIDGGNSGLNWIKKNKANFLSNNKNNLQEIYIPRASSNIWMEERLISLLNKIKKAKLSCQLIFLKGEVISIKKISKSELKRIFFKDNICKELKYKITKNQFKKLKFVEGKNFKSITSLTQSIGLGLPPPRQLANKKTQKNGNYIWDFYSEGSTSKLLSILSKFQKSKKILAYFIGYKAGLLESLPELDQFINKSKINIKLICSSKNLIGIQKASLSNRKRKYKLFKLNKNNLNKIDKAKKLFSIIQDEFKYALDRGYKKYDVWTEILREDTLHKCLSNFIKKEKTLYDKIYHNKLRNLTRFTYPETINARENLFKKKILISNKETVLKVENKGKKLLVRTKNSLNILNNYLCDVVINVSGPLNVENLKNEIPLIKNLKLNGGKVSSGGFIVDKNFQIKGLNKIFTSGILARGFNPERKTIFNAILKNSFLAGKNISKVLIDHHNV